MERERRKKEKTVFFLTPKSDFKKLKKINKKIKKKLLIFQKSSSLYLKHKKINFFSFSSLPFRPLNSTV